MRYLGLDELMVIVRKVTDSEYAVRDKGLLASAVERPQTTVFGDEAYGTLHEKAAALLHSLARNHALVDDNKRTAWLACLATLRFNGLRTPAPETEETASFVEAVAARRNRCVRDRQAAQRVVPRIDRPCARALACSRLC